MLRIECRWPHSRFSFRDVLDLFQEPADPGAQRVEGRGACGKPRRETPPVLAAHAGSTSVGGRRPFLVAVPLIRGSTQVFPVFDVNLKALVGDVRGGLGIVFRLRYVIFGFNPYKIMPLLLCLKFLHVVLVFLHVFKWESCLLLCKISSCVFHIL